MHNSLSGYSYTLEIKPSFPGNLFRFKEYNGIKIIAVFLLLITLIYFGWSFVGLLGNNHQSYSNIGLPNHSWNPFKTLLVSFLKIFQNTFEIFNLIIISLPVIIAFFFAWIVFEPKNVAMYILSITNFLFGIIEIISPVDFLPDFVPLVGSLDDGIIGGGLITYGVFLFFFKQPKIKRELQQ